MRSCPPKMPADHGAGPAATAVHKTPVNNYPNGCHICEVEIDLDTGVTEVVRYSVVDDVGTVLNPMLLHGQIHGGVAQGVGQALMEDIQFDTSGQLVTASFMDYAMPRAHDICSDESREQSGADQDQSARHQRRGRSRLRRRAARRRQRGRRCADRIRRQARRDAGDAGADLAADPRGS